MDDDHMIDMQLSRVVVRDGIDQQWIFLTEKDGKRGFPIIIGTGEAHEIQRVLTNRQPQRPLTHQLAYSAIEALGARLDRVDIVDLRDNTFYARVVLVRDGEEIQLDARPSDALALGLRAGCPIRVAESILESARTDESGPDPMPPADEAPGESPGESPDEPPADPPDPAEPPDPE